MTSVLDHAAPPVPAPAWDLARRPARVLLLLVVVVFLVQALPRVTAPFGESHDGRNGATWASGSRSAREHGLVASRFGAWAPERGTYAHHPPGIYLETWAAEVVAGDHPAVTRAPAWMGSVASIVGLYVLARACRLRRAAALAGTALAVGSPMFLVFGAVLNLEAVSLPWGIALLVLALRTTERRVHPAAMAAVAAGAALTSYQGVVLAGLVAIVAAARWRRRAPRGHELAAVVAFVVAVLAIASWLAWASGGWSDILDQFRARSAGPVGLRPWLASQVDHLRQTFPPWTVVALPVLLWCGWRHPCTRLVVGLSTVVCLVMVVGLRDGAYVHEYWNQWLVIPIALGGAVVAERLITGIERAGARDGSAALVLGIAVVALLGVAATRSEVAVAIDRGSDDGRAAAAVDLQPGQGTAYVFPAVVEPGAWYSYASRLPVTALADARAVGALARREPSIEVVVSRPALQFSPYDDRWDDLVAVAVVRFDWALVVRAPDLAAVLGSP